MFCDWIVHSNVRKSLHIRAKFGGSSPSNGLVGEIVSPLSPEEIKPEPIFSNLLEEVLPD